MLSPYRVLDLTDDRGHLAGFLLAQLGAEVIAIEPPAGHRSRRRAPFRNPTGEPGGGGRADAPLSLVHLAHNRGKASVVLENQEQLRQLAAGADVLIECGAIPLDLADLQAGNPALITVSISPFGETGPKAEWLATDLTIAASSCVMALTGDADRPPVRVTLPQTWHHAALEATCAALIALHERQLSGRGQHADVSTQQSFSLATQWQILNALAGREDTRRMAGGVQMGPLYVQFVYPCKDGHVTVTLLFGPMIGPFTARLFDWIHEDGGCGTDLRDKNWIDFGLDVFNGREPVSEMQRAIDTVARFMVTKTKAELLDAALGRSLLIAPITTPHDVLHLDQLQVRGYWDEVGGLRYPGPFAQPALTPLRRLGPAPELGADTIRVLNEPPRQPACPAPSSVEQSPANGQGPLADVKILDFMWALAGPGATRILADYGATVVRIESQRRPDVIRGLTPFLGTEGEQENAMPWHTANAGKLDLALDLSRPEAREVVADLVRWADVVTESFSPGAIGAIGFGYEQLREIKPDLIMLSSCLMGQSGPIHKYAGFGTMAAAVAGFYPLTGWPDRMPAGPFSAYTDFLSPRFTAIVLLAALEWRRRTGRGQYIDFAQMEAAIHLLTESILEDQVVLEPPMRSGNDDRHMAPHAVYPALGEDKWVAIACEEDRHWQALAELIGRPEWAGLTVEERRERRRMLDDAIAAWTTGRSGPESQEVLQAHGVPAHQVQNSADCVADPQLVERGQFLAVPHPVAGQSWVEGSPFKLSRTPGTVRWAGGTYGQHVQEVLSGLLGYDDDRIADLVIAGVLE